MTAQATPARPAARTARTARATSPTPLGAVLATDAALPHRDALLDPKTAGSRLRGLLTPDPPQGPVATRRVRYQPGRSLRVAQVLHDAAHGHDGVVVSTRGVPADRWDRLVEESGASRSRGGPVVADAATSSVSWVFPHDRRLATLPDVWFRTGPTRRVLGQRWAGNRLMALSPEKAVTLRCLDGAGGTLAYAKVHPDPAAARDAADRADLATLAARPGDLLAPAVLAVVPEACTVVLAAVAGHPLADLDAPALPDALAGLGATLARLHAQPAGTLPPLTRFTAPSLAAAAHAVGAGLPDLADAAAELVAVLAATEPDDTGDGSSTPVPVHGDPSPSNALLTPTGVVLVDFDEAAAGHPAADLACVLAGLRRACLLGTLAAERADVLTGRFTGAYAARAGAPDDAALRWHVAAALLVQGAARAVRRVQPAALTRCDALLDDALGVATGRLDPARSPTGTPWRTP